MTIRTHTEPGGKVENEDFLIAKRHPSSDSVYICLLADGQGGRANGALAARNACETAWSLASELPAHRLFEEGTWRDIFYQVDAAVAITEGFTTLIGLAIDSERAMGASSGDSKAYFVHPDTPGITEWTGHQRKDPPVGSKCVDPESFVCHAVGGGRLLMVSDGVWKYCGYDALRASFSGLIDDIREQLRSAILERSGSTLPDDFSLIAVDVP